jgi:hypothetical protein
MRLSARDSDKTPARDSAADAARTADPGVTDAPAGAAEPHQRARPVRVPGALVGVARILPWVLVGLALVAGLSAADTPLPAVGRYAAYWALCLVLPGTLVYRFLRGSRGSLAEDLGYGAATGLVLELVAWAAAAATGRQELLWAWPIPVVLVFLAVPTLRRHWRTSDPRPLPVAWSWAMAAVVGLTVAWMTGQWRSTPLPVDTFPYYQDLLYHLSLIHEVSRDMPFEVPQLAGEPLRYHYLSNAHMATASLITGTDPSLVLLRLWLGPVVIVAALVIAAFARELARRWWAGPVAALLALAAPIQLAAGRSTVTSPSPLSLISPSLTYLIPLLVLLTALCADLARARRLGRAWFLFVSAAVACAGAKASGLPVLVAGMALAILAGLVARRAIHWPAVAGLAVLLATMAAGAAAFAGGGASVLRPQVLSYLPWLPPYREVLRPPQVVVPADLLAPRLADLRPVGWLFVIAVMAFWLLVQLQRVVGLVALVRRRTRGDGAAWLLAGVLLAGIGGMWMLYHPALSQAYFYHEVVPFGALLTVMLLADALPEGNRITAPVVGAAAVAGALTAFVLPVVVRTRPVEPTYRAWSWPLAQPFLVLGALATVFGLIWYVLRLRFRSLRWHGFAAYLVALVAFSGVTGAVLTERRVDDAAGNAERAVAASGNRAVTGSQIRAALWIDEHAGEEDVVATNVHCIPPPTRPACDSRAFWVTGFGGRRAVMESWGYTDEAVAGNGRNGLRYERQPPPDRERFELNERVFDAPTAANVRTLRDRYGVRWLLADADAGAVSPRLTDFAAVRAGYGPVTIYELR